MGNKAVLGIPFLAVARNGRIRQKVCLWENIGVASLLIMVIMVGTSEYLPVVGSLIAC
jgi:hypothetical protein